jgi:uncharacterized membrane protein YbhN (UPF0104 family)
MKILSKLAAKLNPIPTVEKALMNLVLKNVLQKYLSTLLKGLIALSVGALTLLMGFDPQTALAGLDPATAKITLVCWGLILVALKAAVSALNRWRNFDMSKLGK